MTGFERASPADMGAALELKKRRELALQATDALSELFDADVTIPELMGIANTEEDTPARLTARRALRAVATISQKESEVARRLNGGDVYHYVEGVVAYGASAGRYLELMDAFHLSAEEATGIYALRELIAEYTNGTRPGLQQIIDALASVGISIQHAALDPEHAVIAFDEAGFVKDYKSYQRGSKLIVTRQFDQPVFLPTQGHSVRRLVEDDSDGSVTEGIKEGLRESLRYPTEESDDVDESQAWREKTITDYLKNLDS